MKTFVLLVLLAAALPFSVHADLLVYREKERARVTGNQREVTVPITSYIIHDLDTGSFAAIGLFQLGGAKIYAITNPTPNYVVTHGILGAGSYTVISKAANSNNSPDVIMSSYFAKGRETTLDIGHGETVTFPRSLKAISRSVLLTAGVLATYESSSTLVFQSTETQRANEAGETAEEVIERLRQRFEAQGYVPN